MESNPGYLLKSFLLYKSCKGGVISWQKVDFNIDMVCEIVFLHFFIIKVLTFGLSFNNGTVHAVSEFVFSNNLKFILGTGSQIMDFNFSCIWRIDW